MQEPPIPSPYTAPERSAKRDVVPNLSCPFCEHQFPLLWKQYFASRFTNSVKCPQCHESLKFQLTSAYVWRCAIEVAKIFFFTFLLYTALAFVYRFDRKTVLDLMLTPIGLLIYSISLIISSIFIDKDMVARYRPLFKPKSKK
jgi:hypothetical protein